MRKYLVIVDRNRAEKLTRFANFIIDRVVISVFFLALGFIASLLYSLANIDFLINIVYKMSEMYRWD